MTTKIFKISILMTLLIVLVSACVNDFQSASTPLVLLTPSSTLLPPPMESFGVSYRPNLLISMKWGLASNEMPPIVIHINSLDLGCCGGKEGATVRFRPRFLHYIDNKFHFYVLTISDQFGSYLPNPHRFDLLEFSPQGKLENRFHLMNTDTFIYQYKISSFVVKDKHIYLHENASNGKESIERIRKISLAGADGTDVWQTRIDQSFDLEAENSRNEMYIDTTDKLYLFSWMGRVLQLDTQTGQIIKSFFLSKNSGYSIFLSPSGNFYSDAGSGIRYGPFISCNSQTGECVDIPNNHSEEVRLLSVDEKNNIYITSNGKMQILTPTGRDLAEFPLPDVVVKSADEIYFGFWKAESQSILVRRWRTNGQSEKDIQLSVPGKPIDNLQPRGQLIQVNKDGYFIYEYLYATLHQYDLAGKLVRSLSLNGEDSAMNEYNRSKALFDFESVPTGLNIDRQGRFYLTIMDPEGFKVVRLDLVLPEEEVK